MKSFAWGLVIATVLTLGAWRADACPPAKAADYVWEPPTMLPSNPILPFWGGIDGVSFRSNGVPVPYRLVPTKYPEVTLVEVFLSVGILEIREHSLGEESRNHYLVAPHVVPYRKARRALLDREDNRIAIDTDALVGRIEWDDGLVEVGGFHWIPIDRNHRNDRNGRRYRVVGWFADGTEGTLLEAVYRDPVSLFERVERAKWMLLLFASVVGASWLASRRVAFGVGSATV